RERFIRYISCIALGLPVWYVIGILMFFIPELSIKMGVIGTASAGTGILCCYSGHILGDFCCGLFSQYFKTRRKVVLVYLILTSICIPIYLFQQNITSQTLYMLCVILGVSSGFWVGFMSIASEQFGTNIRATVTTTVPNFVRGALVLMMLLLNFLREDIDLPIITSMLILGVVVMTLSIVSLFGLKETFGKDLNYIEGETI
ncbi:MAG: MFS transporter, partial [Bacteroidota bacterium]